MGWCSQLTLELAGIHREVVGKGVAPLHCDRAFRAPC